MLKITTCHSYTVSRGRYRNPDSAEEETDSAGLLTVTEVVAGRTRISNLDCSVFKAHGPSVTPSYLGWNCCIDGMGGAPSGSILRV